MIKLIEITGCDKKSSNNMILLGVSIKIFEFAFYIYLLKTSDLALNLNL